MVLRDWHLGKCSHPLEGRDHNQKQLGLKAAVGFYLHLLLAIADVHLWIFPELRGNKTRQQRSLKLTEGGWGTVWHSEAQAIFRVLFLTMPVCHSGETQTPEPRLEHSRVAHHQGFDL